MNINDWLDNANFRLENRSVSYAALATEDLPLALIMVRTVLDLHAPEPMGELPPLCQACGPVCHPCKTVRAIENTLKGYT